MALDARRCEPNTNPRPPASPLVGARRWTRPLALLLIVATAACGEDERPPARSVLVVDDGIDPAAPVFAGRVTAAYTVICNESADEDAGVPISINADGGATVYPDGGATMNPDGGATTYPDGGATSGAAEAAAFDEQKRKTLAALRARDESCRLVEGISPKRDPLLALAKHRSRWNALMRGSRYANTAFSRPEFDELTEGFSAALSSTEFHGTATAGVIAEGNPAARLVLVEQTISDGPDMKSEIVCPEQAVIDRTVAVLLDPEVRQAFIEQPLSTYDEDFRALHTRHGIELVNESFGPLSRQAIEELLREAGCPAVTLRRYFAVQGELAKARGEALPPPPRALVVRSAGNEQSRIDNAEDDVSCDGAPGTRLTIGSYGPSGARADFSNFGGCVDAFAPGEQIIAPIPGGWLMPLSGTSFSAPLVVRLLSLLSFDGPFVPAAARDAALALRDGQKRLPRSRFPSGAVYDPGHEEVRFALTAAAGTTPPGAKRGRFSARAVREALWPLSVARGR